MIKPPPPVGDAARAKPEHKAAIPWFAKAASVDPLTPQIWTSLAGAQYAAGQRQDALWTNRVAGEAARIPPLYLLSL
jgi:hypothetical protein